MELRVREARDAGRVIRTMARHYREAADVPTDKKGLPIFVRWTAPIVFTYRRRA